MAPKYRLFATIAASATALVLSAGTVFAQKGLLPPPQPETPPPVPQVLQNYKPVNRRSAEAAGRWRLADLPPHL
jgi:hypothetical protein